VSCRIWNGEAFCSASSTSQTSSCWSISRAASCASTAPPGAAAPDSSDEQRALEDQQASLGLDAFAAAVAGSGGSPYSLDAAGTLRPEIGASVTQTHIVERGASGERLGRCFGQNSPPTLVCRMRGTLCSPSRNAARPPPFKCGTGRGGSDMIRGSRLTWDSCFQSTWEGLADDPEQRLRI